jgi:hypothetical protein
MTDTDAVGEPDMDVFGDAKEVEDELMQTSPDSRDTRDTTESRAGPAKVDETAVVFQDLQRYSPDPEDTIEVAQVVTEDESPPVDEGRSSPDPLFDSPSQLGKSGSSAEPAMPSHRAQAANPLVKLIDAPQMIKNPEVAIPAKARLISRQHSDSTQSASGSNGIQKTRPKPGPGRSVAGLLGKNRSSLLTAGKGGLTSLKGRFKPTNNTREETESIEDVPAPSRVAGRDLTITSWSDEDATGETDHEHQGTAPLAEQIEAAPSPDPIVPALSGYELLKLAGLDPDADMLPAFEDGANVEQPPLATMTAEDEAAEKRCDHVMECNQI